MTLSRLGPGPGYWKNGQLIQLKSNEKYGEVYGLAVAGSDVYIAGLSANTLDKTGTGASVATYWKNGVLVTLPGSGNPTGIAVIAP
jgi:hypothetical protein